MTRIFLPDWLYDAWPWLVLLAGILYGYIGYPLVFAALTAYAGWVVVHRAIYRITL